MNLEVRDIRKIKKKIRFALSRGRVARETCSSLPLAGCQQKGSPLLSNRLIFTAYLRNVRVLRVENNIGSVNIGTLQSTRSIDQRFDRSSNHRHRLWPTFCVQWHMYVCMYIYVHIWYIHMVIMMRLIFIAPHTYLSTHPTCHVCYPIRFSNNRAMTALLSLIRDKALFEYAELYSTRRFPLKTEHWDCVLILKSVKNFKHRFQLLYHRRVRLVVVPW